MTEPGFLFPEWPAPVGVRAVTTTRIGGVSSAPFEGFNLGARTGDELGAVSENRRLLRDALGLPDEPCWLRQVHGSRVIRLTEPAFPEADAAWTYRPGVVLAILTADCLPVVLCDRAGTRVAAVHCGWRGLAKDILEAAVSESGMPTGESLAWLGPAIGPERFEIGAEVLEALTDRDRAPAGAFRPSGRRNRWLCDLYAVARHQLDRLGVTSVHGGGFCTFRDEERFFSYRRDGKTGRMATLIWMQEGSRGGS